MGRVLPVDSGPSTSNCGNSEMVRMQASDERGRRKSVELIALMLSRGREGIVHLYTKLGINEPVRMNEHPF